MFKLMFGLPFHLVSTTTTRKVQLYSIDILHVQHATKRHTAMKITVCVCCFKPRYKFITFTNPHAYE